MRSAPVRNLASGAAAADTRATYTVHVATWLAWCRGVALELSQDSLDDVEDFREALIGAGCQPATVAIKLRLVRRFYDAAVCAGPPRQPGGRRARASEKTRCGGLRFSQ